MTTFNVLYAGQLRFVECSQYHPPYIEGAESIDAVFVDSVFDKWQKNVGSKHSINNLSFEESLDLFKQTINPNNCIVADLSKYMKFIDVQSYIFFKYQQIFLMLDHLKEADVVFFLTPEIVFRRSSEFFNFKKIAEYVLQDSAKAFGWVTSDNHLHNHFMYFNRLGVQRLKETWKHLDYPNMQYVELLWHNIITSCGVEVVPSELGNMGTRCLRFRNNMDFDKIMDYKYLNEQRKQWTIIKNNGL